MANFKLLLNDGTSNLLLNDGTSVLLLNAEEAAVVTGRGGGGIYARLKRRMRQIAPPIFKEETEFSKMIKIKPVKIMTFTTTIEGVPKLTQYVLKITDIIMKPITFTNEIISSYKLKPIVKENVRLGVNLRPFKIVKENMLVRIKTIPIREGYFSAKLFGKTLHGMEMIRKAIEMEKESEEESQLSFDFNETPREWIGSKIYTDAAKFLSFEHSSSFVGRVVYEKETEEMIIVLGDRVYNFCSVPRIIYDGFRTAGSKGKYFNSRIKELWDC